MQIWYATTRPKAMLSKPEAIASVRETLSRGPATTRNVDAMPRVINIMPAIVPTPKRRRYAIAQWEFRIVVRTRRATAAEPARP